MVILTALSVGELRGQEQKPSARESSLDRAVRDLDASNSNTGVSGESTDGASRSAGGKFNEPGNKTLRSSRPRE